MVGSIDGIPDNETGFLYIGNVKTPVPSGSKIFSSDPRIYSADPRYEDVAVAALKEFWNRYARHSTCDNKGMGWENSGIFSINSNNFVARLEVPAGETPDHVEYAPLAILRRANGHLEMEILGHNILLHDPTALYHMGMLLSD